MNLDYVDQVIKEYMNRFDDTNKMIALKKVHTLEVVDVTKDLCKRLKLDEERSFIAILIAYFHDLGRFHQVKMINSFSEKTYNHAEKSVDVIKSESYLNLFEVDEKWHQVIYQAVLNHSKHSIEENLSEEERFFANIIRDADKIDIYRTCAVNYSGNIDGDLNPIVMEEFLNGKSIKRADVISEVDKFILRMAFLNDMVFDESFELLKERNYFQDFINKIEATGELKDVIHKLKEEALSYLERRSYARQKV